MTDKTEPKKRQEGDLQKLRTAQNIMIIAGIAMLVFSSFTLNVFGIIFSALLIFAGLQYFTMVGTRRAKIIERLRGFRKCIADLLPGEIFDEDYNIIDMRPFEKAEKEAKTEDEKTKAKEAKAKIIPLKLFFFDEFMDNFGKKYLGGLRYVGIRGLDDYRRDFKLRRLTFRISRSRKVEIESREEVSDEIWLQLDKYPVIIEKAITKKKERFLPNIFLACDLRVKNPAIVVYVGDPNWVENVSTEIATIFRAIVSGEDTDQLMDKAQAEEIWRAIKDHPNFKTIEIKWGIEVMENGIQILDIVYPPDEQQAMDMEQEQALRMRGLVRQTMGLLLEQEAFLAGEGERGATPEFIKKFGENEENMRRLRNNTVVLTAQIISAENKSLLHIKTDGSPTDSLAASIVAAGRLLSVGVNSKEPSNDTGKKDRDGDGQKDFKKMSKAEIEAEADRILQGGSDH